MAVGRNTGQRTRRGGLAVAVAAALLAAACVPPTQPFTERAETPIANCRASSGERSGTPSDAPPTVVSVDGRGARLIAPPPSARDTPAPLLVSLHPFSMGPVDWERYSGLAAEAAERGYWVLLPRGSDPGPRWAVPGGLDGGPDDIGWIDSLVRATASEVCIDSSRIFAAGFSAGAAMAVGLSCELPWRFAAVAASGGSNLTSTCPTAAPVPALLLHGTADPIAPLTGSTVIFAPPLGLAVSEVVDSFGTRNGCDAEPTPVEVSGSTTANQFSCSGAPLEFWSMRGAGHTWAGSGGLLDVVTGPTDQSFSANAAVLEFFDQVG